MQAPTLKITDNIGDSNLLYNSILRCSEQRSFPSLKYIRIQPLRTEDLGRAASAMAGTAFRMLKPDVRGATVANSLSTAEVLARVNGFQIPSESDIELVVRHPLLYWRRLAPEAQWLAQILFDGLLPQAKFPGEIFSADFTFLPVNRQSYPFTFLPVIDLYSRYIVAWTALFRHPKAIDFITILEVLADLGLLPGGMRTDHGKAFCARDVEKRFDFFHIRHQLIPKRTPQWNGTMESFNRYFKACFLPSALDRGDGIEVLSNAVLEHVKTPRFCIGTTPTALASGAFPEPIYIPLH